MSDHKKAAHNVQNVKVTRDTDAWEVELKGDPPEALATYRDKALKEIQKTAKLDGFRPGKAPIDRIIAVYGEGAVMREAAQEAVQSELPELLASENLLVIESPRVSIDTPGIDKPLAFTARAPLAPQVTLPDHKKIAEKHKDSGEEIVVSDKEHKDALLHLRRERARIDKVETGTEPQKAAEEAKAMEDKDLPALDDEFSKTIGYESAAHFEDTLKLNMKEEKARAAIEKRRTAILDDLVKGSKVSYPAVLREYELNDMEERMRSDLERMGTNFDAYLGQVKKTREEIRGEWKDSADKRAKIRLILSEIARAEKIEPERAVVEHELEHAKEHYKNADIGVLSAHITHAMRNELVLRSLTGESMDLSHKH